MKMLPRLLKALVVVSLVGCAPERKEQTPPGDVAGSAQARLTTSAPVADLKVAVDGNTGFALDLFRQVAANSPGNLFLSPQSITLALSMAYAGAGSTTATAFEDTLQVGLPAGRYHRAMNDLDRQLAARGQGAKAADGKAFRLAIANQLFAERTFGFEQPYLDTLALEYGANVRLVNFVGDAEPSRLAINTWVEQKTEDRIKDLLPQGSVTADTRAVLVNAIYFNAAWKTAFEVSATAPRAFRKLDGSSATVPFMNASALQAKGATVNGVEVVSLPYDGDELSMVLLVPPAGAYARFEAGLTAASLAALLAAQATELLDLSLPKFELRTNTSLVEQLSTLGLGQAFSASADFSKMSTQAQLSISDVVHQTFVKVDEAGTEAAAATGVVIGVTSVPVTRAVVIDRPFLFAIRDDATGAIVFLGRVVTLN